VLTSRSDFRAKNTIVFSDFKTALVYAKQTEIIKKYGTEIFIGGGGEIYKQSLPFMDRLYITRIHKDYEGDAFYPEVPLDQFKEVSRVDREKPVPFSFLVYEKIRN
ncbi:MAG: dihydrofolate reductase, partial [Oligoflexia bacterium]|nr:dihydrofolate reductase [Oligoflexia bacterium]